MAFFQVILYEYCKLVYKEKGKCMPSEIISTSANVAIPRRGGFQRIIGQNYLHFLAELHSRMMFDWYMEIGCRAGKTFGPVRGKTIAVDPFFRVTENVINSKPRLFVFQQTSDDFFADGFLAETKLKLSFSFLDGMHLFEFLLRDFINTEAVSLSEGVIAMHDCCPSNFPMQSRNYTNLKKGQAWTGDVWKLIPIIQEYRPDLKMEILGAAPTGVVLLSNLDPGNRVLSENYDEIISRYTDETISNFGVDNFFDSFEFIDPIAYAEANYPAFEKIRQDPSTALKPQRITP